MILIKSKAYKSCFIYLSLMKDFFGKEFCKYQKFHMEATWGHHIGET